MFRPLQSTTVASGSLHGCRQLSPAAQKGSRGDHLKRNPLYKPTLYKSCNLINNTDTQQNKGDNQAQVGIAVYTYMHQSKDDTLVCIVISLHFNQYAAKYR